MSFGLACLYLNATTTPNWLPLPLPEDLPGAISRQLELVRSGLPEVTGSPAAQVSEIRALYLSEGLWSLEQVCQRLGGSIYSAKPEWLAGVVYSQAYEPLRGLLALSLLTTELSVLRIRANSVSEFQGLVVEDQAGVVTWWDKSFAVPDDVIPGTSIHLDGHLVLEHSATLVWLVSVETGAGTEYKSLARRAE